MRTNSCKSTIGISPYDSRNTSFAIHLYGRLRRSNKQSESTAIRLGILFSLVCQTRKGQLSYRFCSVVLTRNTRGTFKAVLLVLARMSGAKISMRYILGVAILHGPEMCSYPARKMPVLFRNYNRNVDPPPPPKDCVGVRCCEDYWKKGFSRDGLHLGNIRHLDSADVFNTAISPNSVDPHDNHLTRREIKDHNLFHCSQVAK